ncbi:hypothetical protein C8Q78DRAFT_1076065 [Trametes maxima]|nr:hypothetical protein C8Q78DRAFT_1076065 [Trametes maxima]
MTYGVHLTLFLSLVRLYVNPKRTTARPEGPTKRDSRLLLYICTLFALATSGLCLQIWVNHDAFIVHEDFAGGPLAYLAVHAHRPVNTAMTMIAVAVSSYIALNWLADGLLLYRSYVLFKSSRIAAVGCIVTMLALVGVGTAFLRDIRELGFALWTNARTAPSLAYLSLSFSVNVVLTLVIVLRLLVARREIKDTLGSSYARVYTSVMAMVIESASLYTVVALLSIVACAAQSPLQNAVLPILGQLQSDPQAIPPLLITLRVMEGRAVTAETWTSAMSFESRRSSAAVPSSSGSHTLLKSASWYSSPSSYHTLDSPRHACVDEKRWDPPFTPSSKPPSLRLIIQEAYSQGPESPMSMEEGRVYTDSAFAQTSTTLLPQCPPEAHTPVCKISPPPWAC